MCSSHLTMRGCETIGEVNNFFLVRFPSGKKRHGAGRHSTGIDRGDHSSQPECSASVIRRIKRDRRWRKVFWCSPALIGKHPPRLHQQPDAGHRPACPHPLGVVGEEPRNPQSEESRSGANACRRPEWQGTAGDVGSHPGRPSNGCKTCRVARYRWDRPCKELQQTLIESSSKQRNYTKNLRCFWHPSTASGQSQACFSSL